MVKPGGDLRGGRVTTSWLQSLACDGKLLCGHACVKRERSELWKKDLASFAGALGRSGLTRESVSSSRSLGNESIGERCSSGARREIARVQDILARSGARAEDSEDMTRPLPRPRPTRKTRMGGSGADGKTAVSCSPVA